jgi:hypothetical protein
LTVRGELIVVGVLHAAPGGAALAEADGNRTRLTEILGHVGFEDRGGHQTPRRLPAVHPAVDGTRPPHGVPGSQPPTAATPGPVGSAGPPGSARRHVVCGALPPSGVTAAHVPPTPWPVVAPGWVSPL